MEETIQERLGRNVRGYRALLGMNKVEFCNFACLSRPQLDLIEDGRANLKLDTLERLALNIGKEPWQLIF